MQAVMSGDRYALYNLASNDATVAMGVRGWTYLSLMFLPRWPNSAPYFTRKPISTYYSLGDTNACLRVGTARAPRRESTFDPDAPRRHLDRTRRRCYCPRTQVQD